MQAILQSQQAKRFLMFFGIFGFLSVLASFGYSFVPDTGPTQTRFGMPAESSGQSFFQFIAVLQLQLQAGLREAYNVIEQDGAVPLFIACFLYGFIHAVGPGHGKAVISSYLFSDNKHYKTGIALSLSAAFLQAIVAICVVGIIRLVLGLGPQAAHDNFQIIESVAYILIIILGISIFFRKTRKENHHHHDHGHHCGCSHHIKPQKQYDKGFFSTALAAGARPCSGALIVLLFGVAGNMFLISVAGVLFMALGTGMATSLLALFAVFAKNRALQITKGKGKGGEAVILNLEIFAAVFLVWIGSVMLMGVLFQGVY